MRPDDRVSEFTGPTQQLRESVTADRLVWWDGVQLAFQSGTPLLGLAVPLRDAAATPPPETALRRRTPPTVDNQPLST